MTKEGVKKNWGGRGCSIVLCLNNRKIGYMIFFGLAPMGLKNGDYFKNRFSCGLPDFLSHSPIIKGRRERDDFALGQDNKVVGQNHNSYLLPIYN